MTSFEIVAPTGGVRPLGKHRPSPVTGEVWQRRPVATSHFPGRNGGDGLKHGPGQIGRAFADPGASYEIAVITCGGQAGEAKIMMRAVGLLVGAIAALTAPADDFEDALMLCTFGNVPSQAGL